MKSHGTVGKDGSNTWVVRNTSNDHVEQHPGASVSWSSHADHALRFMFDFDIPVFKDRPKSFQVLLNAKAPPLTLALNEVAPGYYCYGVRVESGGTTTPVWAPQVDEYPCSADGSGSFYSEPSPQGKVRPRIRVRGPEKEVPEAEM